MGGSDELYSPDFAGARDRLALAVDQYDSPEDNQDWAAYTSTDPRVANRRHLAMSLWHLGTPRECLCPQSCPSGSSGDSSMAGPPDYWAGQRTTGGPVGAAPASARFPTGSSVTWS